MIEEFEALERIFKSTPLPVKRNVPVAESVGCFLIREVRSKINLPQVRQSGVDGYAIIASDCKEHSKNLSVVGESVAGAACNASIGSGEAFRVFTGSQIPMGANAVVMQEDVNVLPNGLISINGKVSADDYVRRVGEVLSKGQTILSKGSSIKPSTLGALVAGGVSEVTVGSFPSVGIITTGDELINYDQRQIKSRQVYDCNGVMLKSAALKAGVGKIKIKRIRDDLTEISNGIIEMQKWADIILVVGGISVGDRDYVKKAFRKCGIKQIFWRVKIKPGKPMFYGKHGEHVQVFGLPGNPVSAFLCFYLFVLPALRLRSGGSETECKIRKDKAILDSYIQNATDRPHYICGSMHGGNFHPIGNQRSNNIFALSQSDSLLRMKPNSSIDSGEVVSVYHLPS
ncbi:MAG: molybdopterin molybdotransferase MoeA [Verrucomicrobiales bacterium]